MMISIPTSLSRKWLLALCFIFATLPASAQKMGRDWHKDTTWGFRVKTMDRYSPIPIQQGSRSGVGLISKFLGPELLVRDKDNRSLRFILGLKIYAFEDPISEHEADESQSVAKRTKVGEMLANTLIWFKKDMIDTPDKSKPFKSKGFTGEYKEWRSEKGNDQLAVATYTFSMQGADIVFVYDCTGDDFKKYLKVFNKSIKTLDTIERKAAREVGENETLNYETQLEIAQEDCEKTKGWRALPTPSERFIIKTSSDDKGFLKEVIQRLEISRDVFEKDFPPPKNFDAVSIVRICSNSEEFSNYGSTRPGVAGWFSPSTIELVLYDAKNTDRNQSFAVMSHEAFHQYCHFIFDQSEAHRWFDEGHGDYYGGIRIKGKKASITNKMPGGLNRLDVIKEMVRSGTYVALKKHLNFDHGQWQGQGPSNVSCYAQSWSVIYMLRQGALGKVKKKYWDKTYAEVIPQYVTNLRDGYFELRTKLFEKANKSAKLDRNSPEGEQMWRELRIRNSERDDIWKRAMDASWGKLDLDTFELNWLAFVKEAL